MDPAITGTLIGGSFALVGVGASLWATSRTLRANRELAREERLWEKRSATYEQLLAAIPVSVTDDGLAPIFRSLLPLGPSLQAYASDAVVAQWRATVYVLAPYEESSSQRSDSDRFKSVRHAVQTLTRLVREDLQGAERRAQARGRRRIARTDSAGQEAGYSHAP